MVMGYSTTEDVFEYELRAPIWVIPKMLMPTSTNAQTSEDPRLAKWVRVRADANVLRARARTKGSGERILECGGSQDLGRRAHRLIGKKQDGFLSES